MKKTLVVCAALSIWCLFAQDTVSERAAEIYSFSNWCGRVKQDYFPIPIQWTMPVLNLASETNTMSVSVSEKKRGALSELFIFDQVNRELVLNVKCRIATNIVEAHGMMMSSLATITSTYDYSSCTNSFGDRGYDLLGAIKFVRNNVYVNIISCTNSILSSVAEQIDADILAHSNVVTTTPQDSSGR